jgi:hypothetical protein
VISAFQAISLNAEHGEYIGRVLFDISVSVATDAFVSKSGARLARNTKTTKVCIPAHMASIMIQMAS